MSKFLTATATVGALAIGAVAALAGTPPAPRLGEGDPSVSCQLKLMQTTGGVQLEAWVRTLQPTVGEYQLVVTKTGPTGSSDVSQGGAFAARARSTMVLGSAAFALEPRARLKAHLILSDQRGRLCEDQIES